VVRESEGANSPPQLHKKDGKWLKSHMIVGQLSFRGQYADGEPILFTRTRPNAYNYPQTVKAI
jgi:hypothetical protein